MLRSFQRIDIKTVSLFISNINGQIKLEYHVIISLDRDGICKNK